MVPSSVMTPVQGASLGRPDIYIQQSQLLTVINVQCAGQAVLHQTSKPYQQIRSADYAAAKCKDRWPNTLQTMVLL